MKGENKKNMALLYEGAAFCVTGTVEDTVVEGTVVLEVVLVGVIVALVVGGVGVVVVVVARQTYLLCF